MKRHRNTAERLRISVDLLPRHTREAMLRGIDTNNIIVGGYTDRDGGICPMLAAHRNGGRTSFASFARAWDAFTGAGRRPRRASRRETRSLRTYLEMSLLEDDTRASGGSSLSAIADQIRAEHREFAERDTDEGAVVEADPVERDSVEAPAPPEPATAEPISEPVSADETVRVHDMRRRARWTWLRPSPRTDLYEAMLAAEAEISEQRRDEPQTRS
ncbi:MAG: hypothetical protein AABM29_02475 [Actinomycetota bacterium]